MNTSEIDPVLIRCIDGSASAADFTSAWEWIQQSEQNNTYYEQMRDLWLLTSVFGPGDDNRTAQSWLRFKNNHLSSRRMPRFIKIAATLLITILLGGIASQIFLRNNDHMNDQGSFLVEAPRGAKSFVSLSDGTKIWLNAGSKITYHRNYNRQNRNIFLEGEAFFVVAKNKNLPFYVYSSGLTIKALGTSFNVKAYPDEDMIETTLVEGMISIESTGKTGKKEKILIEPNQKVSFYKDSHTLDTEPKITEKEPVPGRVETKINRIEVAKKVNTEIYTSWKDKRWIFQKQKLGDFAVILERLYDVKILFKDEELKQYSLSGSFEEENLEQVLKAIQLTIPLEYSIQHREVVFSINNEINKSYKMLLRP